MYNTNKQTVQYYAQHLKPYDFEVKKILGSGAFAEVVLAVQKTGEEYAIKCIKRKLVNDKPQLFTYIKNEFLIMRNLEHPNIIKQDGIIEDEQFYFIVLQYCNLGNMLNYQSNLPTKRFSVKDTREIIASLMKGLKTIHQDGYIHRDIKPENILIRRESGKITFKIGDFGFARSIQTNVQTYCGTTNFMAPQILMDKPYTVSVDLWSLGVLMYFMLFGQLPFKGMDILVDIRKKCKPQFEIRKSLTIDIAIDSSYEDLLQNFFEKLFVIDPTKRMGLRDMMEHPLFVSYFQEMKSQNLQKYTSRRSTDDSSEEETGEEKKEIEFQMQKLEFLKESSYKLCQKNEAFMDEWERISVKYYLLKAYIFYSQQIINNITSKTVPEGNDSLKIGKWKQFCESQLSAVTLKQLKDNLLAARQQFAKVYDLLSCNPSMILVKQVATSLTADVLEKSFQDFKTSYRAIVGHLFKSVHQKKKFTGTNEHQIKLRLFCCHLINRVFEHKSIESNLSCYFDWKRKFLREDTKVIELTNFKKWLASETKQNLDKTINILYQKYMSPK